MPFFQKYIFQPKAGRIENSKRKVVDFGLGLEMNGLGIEFLKCPVSWTIFLFHVVAESDLKLITAMESNLFEFRIQRFKIFDPFNL